MKMKRGIYVALIVLMLASLACSLGGLAGGETGGGDADVEETGGGDAGESGGGDTGETGGGDTGGSGGEEPAPPEVAPDALEGLNSYRSRMVWRWTPQGGEPETFEMIHEETRDPHAIRFIMNMGPETTEYVQIGDTAWLCTGDTCMQSQQGEEEFMAQFGEGFMVEPADVMSGSEDYRRIGRENVNGIRTQHYRLSIPPAQAMMLAQGNVDDVESEVWIADERDLPAFVVRFRLAWEGTYEGEQSTGEYLIEVTDVNTSFTIEPPAGAEDSGLPEDVPMYPNAEELVVISGNASFTSPDAPETVADFYRSELPGLGWTNQGDEVMGEMINQTWGKEGRTITLTITPQDGGSGVFIAIE